MKNTIDTATRLTLAFVRSWYEADKAKARKGAKSSRTFEELASMVGLPNCVRALWNVNPVEMYCALAENRRAFTKAEREEVLTSGEAAAHGILESGEVAQTQLFISTAIRITQDDWDGAQFKAEVKRAVYMAQAACQYEARTNGTDVTLYVNYKDNAAVRALRLTSNTRNWLRARFGGRLYITDQPNHSGLLLAIIHPNQGERTALGRLEWVSPGFK